jgi:hypothetical protein
LRKISLVWVVLLVLAIMMLMAAPAATLAIGSGGGAHVACGASSTRGCE